jgi:hypothetical protein
MTIIIQEISEMQHLEKAIAETAATVVDWKSKIAGLEKQSAELNGVVTKATASRQNFALLALLGDAKAKAAISSARTAQNLAEEDLADIGHALPAAKAALAEAEATARSARVALAHYQADLVKRHRTRVAGRLDALFAEVAAVLAEFDATGKEIANTVDILPAANMFGTSSIGRMDEIIGNRRLRAAVAAAMGTRLEKAYPGAGFDEMRKEKLQDSETRIWALPDEASRAA